MLCCKQVPPFTFYSEGGAKNWAVKLLIELHCTKESVKKGQAKMPRNSLLFWMWSSLVRCSFGCRSLDGFQSSHKAFLVRMFIWCCCVTSVVWSFEIHHLTDVWSYFMLKTVMLLLRKITLSEMTAGKQNSDLVAFLRFLFGLPRNSPPGRVKIKIVYLGKDWLVSAIKVCF